MIPFKGRLAFKQYMKDKPTKWGIKVFVLADATNGYIKSFQVYTGKRVESRNDVDLCTKAVLDLLADYKHFGLHVYMGNYYSSPNLFFALHNQEINAVGTIRPTRRAYPLEHIELKASVHNRGQYKYVSNGPLLG